MVETLRSSQNILVTSEYAKKWTEKSPNSKLNQITNILSNFKLKDIKEIGGLKTKINKREYREFQKTIGVPYSRCDGKLGGETLNYFNNYIDKIKQQNNIVSQTNGNLSSLQHNIGQIENVTDTINIQHNEAQYLATHETMSQDEYYRLFSGKEKLQQGQFGDCYLVSGINELARAQHFDTLMRTSIQRVKWNDGSGSGYQIKIPLGEPSGRKILLKDSELSVAKIRGNKGYKLLELAYAKNKLRKNDRNGNRYRPITPGEFSKIEGGWTHEVLTTFLGKNNVGFSDFGTQKNYREGKLLSQSSNQAKSEMYNFLRNYNPSIGNKFVSLASLKGASDKKSYTVGKNTLYYRHAYSLSGVKKDSSGNITSIRVLNPWNKEGAGKKYQDFKPNEFFNSFSAMQCGKVKTNTFLDNKGV